VPDATRTLVQLLLLGGEIDAAERAAGPKPDFDIAALLTVAGKPLVEANAPGDGLVRAAIAGLDAEALADERGQRLAEMVVAGRRGEAILAALTLLADGTEVDPPTLRAALFALNRAGQEESAQSIAIETLLLRPPE
jgi:hypothetical protein